RGSAVVRRGRGLVEAVVTEARFVHPVRTGNPRPVLARHLGARVDPRLPLRLELTGVGYQTAVVAEEIHGGQDVFVIGVKVHLADGVVGTYGIGEPVIDRVGARRIGPVVGGESTAVAVDGAGGGEGAAGNLQADGADSLRNGARQ